MARLAACLDVDQVRNAQGYDFLIFSAFACVRFGSEADIALDVGQNLFPGIELLRSKKMTHASSGYCTGEHMQTEQLTWHYSRRVEIELSAGNNKTRRPWPLQSAPSSIVAPSP